MAMTTPDSETGRAAKPLMWLSCFTSAFSALLCNWRSMVNLALRPATGSARLMVRTGNPATSTSWTCSQTIDVVELLHQRFLCAALQLEIDGQSGVATCHRFGTADGTYRQSCHVHFLDVQPNH